MNFLCLLSAESKGEAFWSASVAAFGPRFQEGGKAPPWVRIGGDVLQNKSPAERDDALRSSLLAGLRNQNYASFVLGIAVPADYAEASALMQCVADVCRNTHQVALSIHVFLLVPERVEAFAAVEAILVELTRPESSLRLCQRDLCWVFHASDEAGAPTFAPGSVEAATSSLWFDGMGGTESVGQNMVRLQHPFRYSRTSALVFDRAAWNDYHLNRSIVDLTAFLDLAAPIETEHRAAEFARTHRIVERCFTTLDPPAMSQPQVPEDLTPLADGQGLCGWLQKRRIQMESFHAGALELFELELKALDRPLDDALAAELQNAPDDLQGLMHACAFAQHVSNVLSDEERTQQHWEQILTAALRQATQALLALASRLESGFAGLSMPQEWQQIPQFCITVKAQAAGLLRDDATGLIRCVHDMIGGLLPLVSGTPGQTSLDFDSFAASITQTATRLDGLLQEALAEVDRRVKEAEAPVPTDGAWARLKYTVVTTRVERRKKDAIRSEARTKIAGLRQLWREFPAVADRWLLVWLLWQNVGGRIEATGREVARRASPYVSLRSEFAQRRTAAIAIIESMPDGPLDTTLEVGYLEKVHLAELYRRRVKLRPETILRQVRLGKPIDDATEEPVVLEFARRYRDALVPAITAERETFRLTLGGLATEEFPALQVPRLRSVVDKSASATIPLNDRHLDERLILMEWRHLEGFLPLFQEAFDTVALRNERLALRTTAVTAHVQDTPDRMDLYVHVLGFQLKDYLFWEIFSGTGARSSARPGPQASA